MKNSFRILSKVAAAGMMALTALTLSCNKVPSETAQGTLSWNFSPRVFTRSTVDLPDTDAFVLTVKNSAGEVLYEGAYGDSPESMLVNPGSYTVKVVSMAFLKPEFSAPQFGDEQVVVVQSGANTKARLNCTQLNSGLRLKLDGKFNSTYPEGFVTVSSAEGDLKYGQTERRIGYFRPGNISVALNDGKSSKVLLTRFLEACEVLTLGISCPSAEPPKPGESAGLSITVDTSRVWSSFEYEIGTRSGSRHDPIYGLQRGTGQGACRRERGLGLWLYSRRRFVFRQGRHFVHGSILVHDMHGYCVPFLCDHQELVPVRQDTERRNPGGCQSCRSSRTCRPEDLSQRRSYRVLFWDSGN